MKTLTIIDTFGVFFRCFYALPNLRSRSGFPTGLLTGFINFIYSLEKEFSTDYILFALDSKGKNFRHDIDPAYKANRKEAPDDLKIQLPIAIDWIKKMGFKEYGQEGYEADDVIASMVKSAKKNDIKVRIVTHDKDLYQLIEDGKITIFDPLKKIEIDEDGCLKKFGLPPKMIRDYLSLTGDAADNIPGVRGIGPKGAKTLLDEFNDIETIYKRLNEVRNPRTLTLLQDGKESAFISLKLTALYDSLDVYEELENFKFPSYEPILAIKNELIEKDMSSFLNRVNFKEKKENIETFKPILLDTKEKLFEVVENIPKDAIIAFDTETTSLDSINTNIVGFSFAYENNKAYYVPISHFYLGVSEQVDKNDAKIALIELFKREIVGQNIKFDLNVIQTNFNIFGINSFSDTMLLAWLLNPDQSVGMDFLAKKLLNHVTIKFSDVVPKKGTFADINIEDASKYAAEDAWITLKLFHKLNELLTPALIKIAKDIEFPFINILRKMENEGIKVDTSYLERLLKKSESLLLILTSEIYSLSGCEFNINSPKQLGSVLFETLKLKSYKKTKTGFSTDESVLNELKNDHAIIPKLLEYRELYKLKSTYIEPLLILGKNDAKQRIHTSFLQTGTSTGRLSSKEPNLQNIPVRTELGREVRAGFIAQNGYKLIAIDYSQIELRLLAHFSKDESLTTAFINDKDIHTETAIKLFGEVEAKNKRNVAKSINFGLIYGMGSRKLAQTLGVEQTTAKGYIDSYFKSFKTVKSYLASIEESAKQNGFVETLLGRRRYFDFVNATPLLFANYGRESINAVFQGSAADLIKLAMLKIYNTILNDEAKLLLQIHDELIFEVKEENAIDFANRAADIMINIYKLNIPLKTSISIGNNWGELK